MSRSLRDLTDLLRACVVRVSPDGCDGGGTGVWAAPGLVLTCAHVVTGEQGTGVDVRWGDATLAGVVTAVEPPGRDHDTHLWPHPDLAIILVRDPPRHPCAWLCEQRYAPGVPVTAVGHSSTLQGAPHECQTDGHVAGRQRFGGGWMWQLAGNEIDEGMSGGPVLDHHTGAVCGIITTTRQLDTDRGGYFVPLDGLRQFPSQRRSALLQAHDAYHAAHPAWTDLRTGLLWAEHGAARLVTPQQDIALLGTLAGLPPVPSFSRLYAASTHSVRKPAPVPLDLRDCAYALLDEQQVHGELAGLLRLTDLLSREVADDETRLRLRDWTTDAAAKLDEHAALHRWRTQSPGGRQRSGCAVIVQLAAGTLTPDRYQITIWLHRTDGEIVQAHCDDTAVHTLDAAKALICEQLRQQLAYLHDDDITVEFVTDTELFDEPFDELVPTKPYTNLGRKYPVVLRDLDRLRDATTHGPRRRDLSTVRDWRRRWQQLHTGTAQPHWLGCVGLPDPPALSSTLQRRPELAVLGLARGPSHDATREALEVALDHGLPAAVWRRRCPEHDRTTQDDDTACTGTRFTTAFTAAGRR